LANIVNAKQNTTRSTLTFVHRRGY